MCNTHDGRAGENTIESSIIGILLYYSPCASVMTAVFIVVFETCIFATNNVSPAPPDLGILGTRLVRQKLLSEIVRSVRESSDGGLSGSTRGG